MYDPVLLRTFLAVEGGGGFTAAARQLGISQPTVSQQMRRLEDEVGRSLFVRETRGVRLTEAGEALAGFARTILAAMADAESWFRSSPTRGRLRFGTADDLAITQLPRILRQFRRLNPQVDLELTVDQSAVLARRLAAGHLDLVFLKQPAVEAGEGTLVLRDQFVWVAEDAEPFVKEDPLPLIAYRSPSFTRRMATDALDAAGRRWRIACTVRDIGAVLAATRAGLGVSVLAHSLIPSDLQKVETRLGLPGLGGVDFRLVANPSASKPAVEALTAAIRSATLSAPVG
ncbi:LysR substrate-binding domain-containing protein [Amnibacterium endophyticum]|uniref:LysR substrate-binding domain-containing protein n=1 Tax=Amnibacterium endophyticum TaxID=2109337 RepID=A0ABW4LEV4_9MICO